MTHMELGIYGAKRQTWAGNSARGILEKLIKKNPTATIEELTEEMLLKLSSEKVAREIVEYWVANNRRSIISDRPSPRPSKQKIEEERKNISVLSTTIFRKVKSRWLSHVMQSTFGELALVGGQFSVLSKMGKPNEVVGNVLTEKQIMKVLK